MTLPDNEYRADKAADALAAYVAGRYPVGEEPVTVLGDLLSDLRHLADRYGIAQDDFDRLALSRLHYDAEIHGDDFTDAHPKARCVRVAP